MCAYVRTWMRICVCMYVYIIQEYRTHTNFRGTYISRMPQIQHFHDFNVEDHRILYW